MRGEFIVIPIAAAGSGVGAFIGITLLFGLAASLSDNASKMADHLESKQMTSLKHSMVVKTAQVNEIKNNQATVSIGVDGPYLECSHSPNVTIRPIVTDTAQIRYKNNIFSWYFYDNGQHTNNRALLYLIYHDSPHGQVELLCIGKGWNEGTSAIRFVLLPPHNEMWTTTQENDPFASDMSTPSDVPMAEPNSEAPQAEAALSEEATSSGPPIESQEVSATNETVQEEPTPIPEIASLPEYPLRHAGKLSSEELERIVLIEMQKMRDGH